MRGGFRGAGRHGMPIDETNAAGPKGTFKVVALSQAVRRSDDSGDSLAVAGTAFGIVGPKLLGRAIPLVGAGL